MPAEWYYLQDGQPHGPVERDTLQQLLTLHALSAETHVWRQGMSEWLPASSLGFQTPSPVPVEPPPAPIAPPPPPIGRVAGSIAEPAPPPVAVRAGVVTAPAAVGTTSSRGVTRGNSGDAHRLLLLGVVAALSIVIGIGIGWFARSSTLPPIDMAQATSSLKPAASGLPVSSAAVPDASDSPGARPDPQGGNTQSTTPVEPPMPPRTEPPPLAQPTLPPQTEPQPPPVPAADSPLSSPQPTPITPDQPLPATSPTLPPQSPSPKSAASNSFFQEIDVERLPRFSVLGTAINQDLRYQILSELHVDPPDAEGTRSVEQTVIDTKLVRADELSRGTFPDALRELKGQRFHYKVNRAGAVTELDAADKGGRQAVAARLPGAQGFAITSVMDPDGWREMAELTFLAPPPAAPTSPWTRGMRHEFGPLGSWYGETQFRPGEARGGSQRIDFSHQLTYQPPGKGAGGLPFTIRDANLKPETASGIAQFDLRAGRITTALEKFVVRGQVNAELVGQAVPIELEETQTIKIAVSDRNPWK